MSFQIQDPIIWDLLPSPRHEYAQKYVRDVASAIQKTLAPGEVLGESQVKERAVRCRNIVKVLMGDCMWTYVRTMDHLATYLRMELLGMAWTPDGGQVWGEPDSLREAVATEALDVDAIRRGVS